MRIGLVVLLLCGVSGTQESLAPTVEPCSFKMSPEQIRPQILAPPDVMDRIVVIPQPDSPLAILRADLTNMRLAIWPGSSDEQPAAYTLDVKNVGDQPILAADVSVFIGRFGSGHGSGGKLGRPLAPGQQTRIAWRTGGGHGTGPASDEPAVTVFVEHIKTAPCDYRPSQRWLTRNGGTN